MDHQTSSQPPTLPLLNKKSKWRWLKIIVGIGAALFLAINLLGIANSPKLELTRQGAVFANDGMAVEVTNVGSGPVRIDAMTINDRTDCKAGPLTFGKGGGNFPVELKVGDKQMFIASCRVIRVSVETDQGSNAYSFKAN